MNIKQLGIHLVLVSFLLVIQAENPTTLKGYVDNKWKADINFDGGETRLENFPTTYVGLEKANEEVIQLAEYVGYLDKCNENIKSLKDALQESARKRLAKYPNKQIAQQIEKIIFLDIEKLTREEKVILASLDYNQQLKVKSENRKQWHKNNVAACEELEKLLEQIGPDNTDKPEEQVKIESLSLLQRLNNFIFEHKIISTLGGLGIISGVGYAVYNWYQKNEIKQENKKEDDVLSDFINLA